MLRQLETPISQPPSSGPITVEMPLHAVQVPIAAPRAAPENVPVIKASEAGVSSAPAMPCSPRKTIERVGVRRQRAEGGREPERRNADSEHAKSAEDVSERPAHEDQRAERQQIRVDDPLLRREPAAEIALNRWQGDVDHCRVDEDDGRAQDRCNQREAGSRRHLDENTNMNRSSLFAE